MSSVHAVLKTLLALSAITAQAQSGYLTYPTGANPSGVAAADLNGDGKPDLVIANAGSDSLTVLLNNGANGFSPSAPVLLTSATTATTAPRTIVVADLNGDGKADLVVTANLGLVVLLGNGDGTFRSPQTLAGGPQAIAVQVADLNGDKIPDLAVTFLTVGFPIPTGATLAIYPGKGDGTFSTSTSYFLGFTPWAVVAIGDFNKDGKPDLAVAIGQHLMLFLNDGAANFKTVASDQLWNFAPGITTGDFNGDGLLDLVVSGQVVNPDASMRGQGIITILLGKGDGTFQARPTIITTPAVGQVVSAADLNGDGRLDLVAGLNSLFFFAGRGDGTFGSGIPFGGSGNTGYLAVGDFSGSGGMGFAGTNSGGNVVVLPRAIWPSVNLALVSAAGFGLGPLAPGSMAAATGSNLANQTATAPSGTPPILLGGDSVSVTGSDGKALQAELYYVSPGQVNYLIPTGTALGLAAVRITSNGSVVATGSIDIAQVAPALFTFNSANLAAAYVTRVSQSGQQTYQPVYTTDPAGNLVALPIDLGPETDTVYISIFGTGIRNASNTSAVMATFGRVVRVNAQVAYAGPQGSVDGLDQVNILLPKTLAAATAYSAALQLTVDGQASNPVMLTIQ